MSSHPHAYTLPYVALPNAFTSAELDVIEKLGDSLTVGRATIAERPPSDAYADIRVTQTAWIHKSEATHWLYERMTGLIQTFNVRFFEFELIGFSDPFQYTVYQAREGGHYDWHVDQGATAPRKLSLTLQLTDPAAYEGCDLQMRISNRTEAAPRERGTLIAFPSWVLHRVTPIVSGTRKSMVVWAAGPKFR